MTATIFSALFFLLSGLMLGWLVLRAKPHLRARPLLRRAR